MDPKFQVQLKIRKPVAEVFDAVVNPDKLTRYFIQTTTGPMVPGSTVMWKFPEYESLVPVTVEEVSPPSRLVFAWPADGGAYLTRVEMSLETLDSGDTMVRISESGWPGDARGLERSHGNAGGWMHMLTCLKGWIEYGINLREGGAV